MRRLMKSRASAVMLAVSSASPTCLDPSALSPQRCRSHLVSEHKLVDRLIGMQQGQLALRLSTLQAAMGLRGFFPGIGFGDIGINGSTGD